MDNVQGCWILRRILTGVLEGLLPPVLGLDGGVTVGVLNGFPLETCKLLGFVCQLIYSLIPRIKQNSLSWVAIRQASVQPLTVA